MKILFIGDSLIEYFDWAGRFPGHEVYNLGIGGETVEGLYRRLERVFSSMPAADMVFIMSGINNLSMGDTAFVDTYGKLLEAFALQYPSAKIFIHSLLPVNFPFVSNDDIRDMNRRLQALAEEKKVRYIDIHSRFLNDDGMPVASYLLDDGVHVSDEGYRIWSREIEKLLG